MGFDFDIDARILHRETGEIMSGGTSDGYTDICSWYSRMFLDIRPAIISIRNQYADKPASLYSYAISVPQTAMRPICAYLFSRCCVPDGEPELDDWNYRQAYEITNLPQAQNLQDLLTGLARIEQENKDSGVGEMLIPDPEKRRRFQENPQAYAVEFVIFNDCSDDRLPVQPEIRQLTPAEHDSAFALILRTFLKYEAPDYTPEGVQEFQKTLHDLAFLRRLTVYGAFVGNLLAGVGASRDGSHLALLFVDSIFQRLGIGKALVQHIAAESGAESLTVNSSPYAVPFYHKLGFRDTDTEQCINGLRFTPMILDASVRN